MSTATTSDKFTSDKYTQIRGDLRALLAVPGHGADLWIVTTHPQGAATALYRLNVDSGDLQVAPLGAGAVALIADDSNLFVAGTDGHIYRGGLDGKAVKALGAKLDPAPTGLALASKDRLAVVCGKELVVVQRKDGKELQRLPLNEIGASIASDPSGVWLVVGGDRGSLSVFDCEDKDRYFAAESKKLHEGAVTGLLFEPEELRVMSVGNDNRLLLTHVRGPLEAEDRGGKNGHSDRTTALIAGVADKFYTAGQDSTIKTWTRGSGQRRPSTQKDGLAKINALALAELKGRPCLVAACVDKTLRVFPVDAGGKVGDRVQLFHGAHAWAEYELKRRDPKLREASLRTLAGWNDADSLDLLSARVSQDEDHGLKVLATELLGASGSPRAVKLLEPLLQANEEAVRMAALTGLRKLEGPTSLRILDLALAAQKRDVGVAAVEALTELARKDDLALAKLTAALGQNPREVRLAALVALEALHPAKSPEAELVALRAKQADIRRTALVRFYQRDMLDTAEVQAALRRFSADADAGVRQAAFLVSLLATPKLAAALRFRDKQIHRLLHDIETAPDPTAEVKAAAAKAEAKKDGKKDSKPIDDDLPKAKKVDISDVSEADKRPLLEAMASRALDTCLAGATGLAALQDPRALGTLLQLSRETTASVRVETCKALAELGDPRGAARLRLMLRDTDASVRDAAFTALVRLEDAVPLAVAAAGLGADHEDVRRRGLDLLVKHIKKNREPTAISLLERALGDAGKTVRSEAFKAALSLEVGGPGAGSLRFALKSLHADVRREVLNEVLGQISQSWAWPLLLEMLADPDPAVRKEAFDFALKRTKGIGLEPLSAALSGKYADLRVEATKVLAKRKAAGTHELLVKAVDDEDETVRQLAVDALLVAEGDQALTAAMASKYPDVVVRAASARAVHGDASARAPLVAMIAEAEPETPALRPKWLDRVVRALSGLAELGDPAASSAVLPLLQHKEAKIRQAAATALAWMARPGNANAIFALQAALQHSDPAVQAEAALGLAACGDASGASIIFTAGKNAPAPELGLLAALALGADDAFVSYLDHNKDRLRDKALLLVLMREMVEADGVPDRCLAALASAHPRVRLVAAQALEHFGDDTAFAQFVTDMVNDRGEGKTRWTIPGETVQTIAEVITFGDGKGNPQLKVRAARLLDALAEEKQETFDRQWATFSRRFAEKIAAVHTQASKCPPGKPAYAPEELRQVVFGAYAALSRLPGGNAEMRIRQTAISRLLAVAPGGKEKSKKPGAEQSAVQSVLVLALGDPQQAVRKQAFDGLKAIGMDPAALAAEALATGQRDAGALGLALLAQLPGSGKGAKGLKVLEDVLVNRDDGLEQEAAKLLASLLASQAAPATPASTPTVAKPGEGESEAMTAARRDAWVQVHTLALGARSEVLRQTAVSGLAGHYEPGGAGPAAKALRDALASKYRAQRFAAAEQLATKKDAAAFDVLVEKLRSDQASEQSEAIRALQRLGDPRATAAFMNRIDDDPAGSARIDELIKAVGTFAQVSDATRVLAYVDTPKRRAAAFAALLAISGHDQRIEDPEDEGARSSVTVVDNDDDDDEPVFQADWEKKQRPRHDQVLVQIAEAARRLSDDRQLQAIALPLRWARGKEIDAALAPLVTYPKPEIARKATEAIGWRLRKRGGPADPLLAALKSQDPEIAFLAAEGLALAGRGDGVGVLLTSSDLMPDLGMRRRAVKALGALADIRALDTLLRFVNEDGHALQDEAAEALGHMAKAAEQQPGQVDKIFAILAKLAAGTGTAAQRALVGLRWFGTREAWQLVRGRVKDDNFAVRQTVARLLEYDTDPHTRELIGERLREETYSSIATALAHSLRKLYGADSLEPDYVFLQAHQGNLEKDTLERLRRRGDPARLLELLPRIKRKEHLEPILQILLSRTPLPIDAAVPQLGSTHPRVAAVAAEIVGRAGPAAAKAHGKRLTEVLGAARERWLAEYTRLGEGKPTKIDEVEPAYRSALWAAGRLDVAADELVAALTLADGTAFPARARLLRRQAALSLADGAGGKAGLEALRAVLKDSHDAELRGIAASGLAQQDTGKGALAKLVPAVLDDGPSLARIVTADVLPALRIAAADSHRQGTVLRHLVALGDSAGVLKALPDAKHETARLGLVEALGKIADEPAMAALRKLGADESEDEELRKAAWRALRRAKRNAAERSSPRARHGRWEVQP